MVIRIKIKIDEIMQEKLKYHRKYFFALQEFK